MSPGDGAAEIRRLVATAPEITARDTWGEPDMDVLRLHRRAPPSLLIAVFALIGSSLSFAERRT